MSNWIVALVAGFTLASFNVEAHEGHGIPGALPPAPHGGVVQEAEHTGADLHGGDAKEETELFIEVVYKNKQLAVYPLTLDPKKPNSFLKLSPTKDLSKVTLKAEFPRKKQTEVLVPKVEEDAIRASFDSKGANRFIVHLSTEFHKESKVAKVQIEAK